MRMDTVESSHRAFTTTFPRCFALEVLQLDEHSKIVKVEFFYDRGELLGGLLKGATSDVSKTEMPSTSSCPFLKNTG
ncbi:hypothetical protein Acr_21g0005120 [Actinidia rufa]|uniref:Uncharacterized protein n=1 Tax=Actinidia rufa TaxID=165716 RepID=A0A7J0GGG6_9ERIC|nr:hypothetical protein Acr_21g0005120 [Actinidia rufa]